MEERTVDYQGKGLFYRTKGSGPIVVLLHGFPEDGTIWKNQFDLFPNNQLIVPDLPGSGKSEIIDDMSMEGLAEAVKAVIEAASPNPSREGLPNAQPSPVRESTKNIGSLKSETSAAGSLPLPGASDPPAGGEGWERSSRDGGRAVLIGHSMGGYVTLAFAEKYPERVNGFGLFHSTAFADNEERKEKRRKAIATVKAQGIEAFLKTFVPALYSPVTKEKAPALIDEHLASVRNFSAEACVRYFEAMMARPDRTAVLRESGVPVLFVMGRHDGAVPLEDGLKQVHLPQTAHIHLLEASAHEGMREEAAEANKILTQFVKAGHNAA